MSDNRILYLVLGTVALIAIVGGGLFFVFTRQHVSSNTDQIGANNVSGGLPFSSSQPFSVSTTNATQSPNSARTQDTISIQGASGSVTVSDFRVAPGVTTTPLGAEGVWWFPGSDATISPAALPPYDAYYFPRSQSFLVVLLTEPIAQARAAAALDIESKLGISAGDICNLKYEVTVPPDLNLYYAAKNLGFPGCPGAIRLPGD